MYGCRFCHKNKMGVVVDFSQHSSSLALSSSSGSYSLKNTSRLLKKIRRNKFSTLSSPVRSIVQVNQAQQCFAPIISCKIEPDPDEENEQVANNNIGVQAALSTLRFYKREISPLLPKSCRYVPTCSEYSMIAYNKYGFVKGTLLTACRICRCNPLGGSGFDPPRWFDEKRVSQEEENL